MGLFDNYRRNSFKKVLQVYGDEATTVSFGSGKILVNEPTEKDRENGVDFTPFSYFLEWEEPHFPGLFQAVLAGSFPVITVGSDTYTLRSAEALADGKSYKALAEKNV